MERGAPSAEAVPVPRDAVVPAALGHVRDLARDLASALDVAAVVQVVCSTGSGVLGASSCSLSLLDPLGAHLVAQVPRGAADGVVVGPTVALTTSTPSAEAARTGRPVLLTSPDDLRARFEDPLGDLLDDEVLARGERSWAVYPVLAHDRTVGVLRLGFARDGGLDEVGRVVAATLADQAAIAVERARLLRVHRDTLLDAARSEQRYRTLAEARALDVFTVVPGVGLVDDLPGLRALTGWTGGVLGVEWQALLHPDDLDPALAEWSEAVAARRPAAVRARVRAGFDGARGAGSGGGRDWRTVRATVVPVTEDPADPASTVVEWIGALDDVTARVHADRRARSLQSLTTALTSAVTPADVVTAVLTECLDGPGAVRATLLLVADVPDGAPVVPLVVHRLQSGGTLQTVELTDHVATPAAPHAALVSELVRVPRTDLGVDDVERQTGLAREQLEAGVAAGEVGWTHLPLVSRGRRLGTLSLTFAQPPPRAGAEGAQEADYLDALARQAATALDRVRVREAELSTAVVLQEALQPGPLPRVGWLQSHRLTATSAGTEVGGDWAEVVPLPAAGGVPLVALVLGDVMGRGARAATVMGEIRAQVRALALIDPDPTAVLRGLDRCVAAAAGDDLATLFYGVLRADGDLVAASAGHLPPLALTPAGAHYLDVEPGLPLGVAADIAVDDRAAVLRTRLEPGDTLVVFSDGLVETRERPLQEGLDRVLAQAPALAAAPAAEVVEGLTLDLARGEEVDDDVTVLVVRLDPPRPDPPG